MPHDPPPRECAAIGCERTIETRYIMCRDHWAKVPRALQTAIHEACRPGSGGDLRASRRWVEAVADAVEDVARSEGRPPANRFRKALGRR